MPLRRMGRRGTKEGFGADGDATLAERTKSLFEQWREGDDASAARLFELHERWMQDLIERELGTKLRSKVEPADVAQELGLKLLQYEPKAEDGSVERFRALLKKIAKHIVTDLHRHHFEASKRGGGGERRLLSDTRVQIDPPRESITSPSGFFARNEDQVMARLVFHFLSPDRGDLVGLRAWFDLPFADLSRRYAVEETALRMRLLRAMEKAAAVLAKVRNGVPRLPAADRNLILMRIRRGLSFQAMAVALRTTSVDACAAWQQAMRRLGVMVGESFRPLPDDWPRCVLDGDASAEPKAPKAPKAPKSNEAK